MSFMDEFDHLKIRLKEIMSATDDFGPNKLIGRGGFGLVYKGELALPQGKIMVACKHLDRNFGQGNIEFWKEVMMLSKCKHENLITLLYFCVENDERILVYEYASRGSLDRYLSDASLTWTERLKICIGVARAINYLHDPMETHQRVLHRDIKSSNILLNEKLIAKVSDFGLSKFGPANQPQTYIVSNAVGTPGYCDPLYWEMGFLSKESDVYSLGVVLFEVVCDGGLVQILVNMWKNCYDEKRLDDIIFHGLKEHMTSGSLNTFSNIAYRCLKKAREERPTMAEIVQELEIALDQQEINEDLGKKMDFEGMRRIANMAKPPLYYTSQSQLLMLLSKGLLVDEGKTWFSMNEKQEHYEFIFAVKCISKAESTVIREDISSRFGYLFKYESSEDLEVKIKTQFLTPNVTYIINLVFSSFVDSHRLRVPFKYKLEEMTQYSTSCVAYLGRDGFRRTELFQFISNKEEHHFNIQFLSEIKFEARRSFSLEGVEFCPLNDYEKDENVLNIESSTYTDSDWGNKLPKDYSKIVKWPKDIKHGFTEEKLYFLLRKGLLINKGQQWFSISKKSKKRYMLPARAILPEDKSRGKRLRSKNWIRKSSPGSRFDEVAEICDINHLPIVCKDKAKLLSPETIYACYLVYKLPENASVFEGIVSTAFSDSHYIHRADDFRIYLVTPPHTPSIVLSTDERPSKNRKIKGHPKLRKDGWMEVQVSDFKTDAIPTSSLLIGYLKSLNEWNFTGFLVQGIEFRPMKVSFFGH